MQPKPFSALNHFTVPCATCAPTFRACGRPLLCGGTGLLALPPVEHERGTRTARDGTAQGAWSGYIHAHVITGSGELGTSAPPVRTRFLHPTPRGDASSDQPRGAHRAQ